MQSATQAATTSTQAAITAPAAPTVVQPTRILRLGAIDFPRNALAAPADGQAAFMLTREPSINLWRSLVYSSPEILVGVGLLLTVVVMRRVASRPQTRGEPYCRRCNYLVKNLTVERCPECGGRLGRRGVMRGSRRSTRIALLVSLDCAFLTLYFTNSLSLMRNIDRNGALDWRTRALNSFASRYHALWQAEEPLWSVLRIDLETGVRTSAPIDLRGSAKGLAISADGRTIAVHADDGIRWYEWPSGKLRSAIPLNSTSLRKSWFNSINDVAYSDDLATAWVVSRHGEVERWSMSTGQTLRLFTPDEVNPSSNIRWQLLVPPRDVSRMLLYEYGWTQEMIAISPDGSKPVERRNAQDANRQPPVWPDIHTLYLPHTASLGTQSPNDLILRRTNNGQELVVIGGANMLWHSNVSSIVDRGWIIALTLGGPAQLRVWSTATGKEEFVLAATGSSAIDWMQVGDRRIIRLEQNSARSGYDLAVFDLPAAAP